MPGEIKNSLENVNCIHIINIILYNCITHVYNIYYVFKNGTKDKQSNEDKNQANNWTNKLRACINPETALHRVYKYYKKRIIQNMSVLISYK